MSGAGSTEVGDDGNYPELGYSQHKLAQSNQLLPSVEDQGQSAGHNSLCPHLEEKGTNEEKGINGEDPDGIEGVTEEFLYVLPEH